MAWPEPGRRMLILDVFLIVGLCAGLLATQVGPKEVVTFLDKVSFLLASPQERLGRGYVTDREAIETVLAQYEGLAYITHNPLAPFSELCQRFGNPIHYQPTGYHTGIDLCAPTGTPIYAVGDGLVVYVGWLYLRGARVGRGEQAVVISHGEDVYSTYSHNSAALVRAGEYVVGGQLIARVGSEGYSGGPHLHFEILVGVQWTGTPDHPFEPGGRGFVDPMYFLPGE